MKNKDNVNISKENVKKGILAGLEELDESSTLNIKDIDIKLIDPNPNNFYNVGDIELLADDIKENGLYHPILVRPIENEKYQIISGERRYRAVISLGMSKIPCNIKDNVNDIDSDIMLIQANARARELTDLEKARQIKKLEELYNAKKERGENIPGKLRDVIGKDMGLSGVQVQRYKKLLNLTEDLQKLVDSGELPMSTAEHFSSMSEEEQIKLYDLIKNKGMEIGRDEAKELKNKLEQYKDDEVKQKQIIDDLSDKVKNFEVDKEKIIAELKILHEEELKKSNADKENLLSELDTVKKDIEAKEKALDEQTTQIKEQLLKEQEQQKTNNTTEQQQIIDELKRKLEDAETEKDRIEQEKLSIEKENEIHIKKLEDEQKDLVTDYESKLGKVKDEFKEKEINQKTIEINMEILALSKQANQLMTTIVSKISQAKSLKGFEMTDEVKTAIANVAKFGNDISKS